MSARFRIRTPQGQELSFGSEEMFADFVKSGELSSGDLVYDATTGEWSPALTHSLVLGLQGGVEDAAGDAEDAMELDFQLAPEQTPEEAAAAFVKEMEAERESAFERRQEMHGLKTDEGGKGLLRDLERAPPPPPGPGGFAADPPGADPVGTPPPFQRASRKARSARASRGPGFSRAFLSSVVVLGAVGLGVLLGPDLVALAMNTERADPGAAEGGMPILPDTEEALRARADARFLSRSLASLSGLPVMPREWLDGRYLANASQYPGVREVWRAYLDAMEQLRSEESEYYSAAYLSALDDARVTGATRTLRLASALSRFDRDGSPREAHYDRVIELTTAAIDLHDLLVQREGSITYEPAVGTRVSADPVLQAAAVDSTTQRLLETALDRVLDALSVRRMGPVEAAGVRAWMFEGLRDAVAPE